jgi:Outer membrane protein beta-barrel domain
LATFIPEGIFGNRQGSAPVKGTTMRRLFSLCLLVSALAAPIYAQDPMPQGSQGHSGYGDGGRAEVFVSGFGLLSNSVSGNSVVEQTNNAGGVSAGYRFHLNGSSALEGRYGFSRNTQTYSAAGSSYSIPTYFSEISGSYIYNFANAHRIQPFLEGGGGVVVFSPANYGGSTTSSAFGYGVTNGTSAGSSLGLARQLRGMFVYGAGADMPASSHLNVRLEFRSVGYNTPDFGTALIHTNTFSFAYEPSIGFAYRF